MKKFTVLFIAFVAANMLFAQYNKIDTSIYSPALGEDKMVDILLPPGYYDNPDEHYPVIYFLHGAGGNQNSYSTIYSHTYSMINNGTVHPFILVKPDGSCPPYMGSVYVNSILYGNYEDYLVFDLVAWIDSTYRTIPERQFRCITGHSMGGGGAAGLASHHPDVYRGFAGHAGTMNFDTTMTIWVPEILDEIGGPPPYNYYYGAGTYTNFLFTGSGAFSPNLNNPTFVDLPLDENGVMIDSVFAKWKQFDNCCLVKQVTASDNLGIFFSCGSNDELGVFPGNLLYRDTLDMLGLDYEFLITQGDHTFSPEMIQAGYIFLDSIMWTTVGTEDHYPSAGGERMKVSVHPNPTTGMTCINLFSGEAGTITIQVRNAAGVKVYENCIKTGPGFRHEERIDLSGQAPGIYFIQTGTITETLVNKIIKIR